MLVHLQPIPTQKTCLLTDGNKANVSVWEWKATCISPSQVYLIARYAVLETTSGPQVYCRALKNPRGIVATKHIRPSYETVERTMPANMHFLVGFGGAKKITFVSWLNSQFRVQNRICFLHFGTRLMPELSAYSMHAYLAPSTVKGLTMEVNWCCEYR